MASDAAERLRSPVRGGSPGDDKAIRLVIANLPTSDVDVANYTTSFLFMASRVTVLHKACESSDPANVRTLLQKGSRQLYCGYSNCTSLHIAVHRQNLEVVKVLLENIKDDEARGNYLECRYSDEDVVHTAAGVDSLPILRLLIDDAGAKLGSLDIHGMNCLHIAARKASPELIEFLLLRMSDDDIQRPSAEGFTPLDLAGARSNLRPARSLDWEAITIFVEREITSSQRDKILYCPQSTDSYVVFGSNNVCPPLLHDRSSLNRI